MKSISYFILCFIFLIAFFNNAIAQDNIILYDATEIQAKVLEIGTSEVSYKKFENIEGPTYRIEKAKIFMIKYENGSKDVFKTESNGNAGNNNSVGSSNNNNETSKSVGGGNENAIKSTSGDSDESTIKTVDNVKENTETKEAIKIGDKREGGIVFYVDETGQHGLIAAIKDVSDDKIIWGANNTTLAKSFDDGRVNMKAIAQNQGEKHWEKSAAYQCDCFKSEGKDDWYLPAISELRMLFDSKELVGNFHDGDYCSSTEYGREDAYFIHFKEHRRAEFYYNKDNRKYYARCIRRF